MGGGGGAPAGSGFKTVEIGRLTVGRVKGRRCNPSATGAGFTPEAPASSTLARTNATGEVSTTIAGNKLDAIGGT